LICSGWLKIQALKQLPKNSWNDRDAVFNSYSALLKIILDPTLFPNSGPALVHIFSAQGAIGKAFPISPTIISRLFCVATIMSSRTEISSIVDKYVTCPVESITCPPRTNHALCCKSCCLISKIMCIGAYCHLSDVLHACVGLLYSTTFSLSKAVISAAITSAHFVFLFFLSSSNASRVSFGTLISYRSQYMMYSLTCGFSQLF
jgi:hypothetical protein